MDGRPAGHWAEDTHGTRVVSGRECGACAVGAEFGEGVTEFRSDVVVVNEGRIGGRGRLKPLAGTGWAAIGFSRGDGERKCIG